MVDNIKFNSLLKKYLSRELKNEEHNDFFEMLSSGKYDETVGEQFVDDFTKYNFNEKDNTLSPIVAQEILHKIGESKNIALKIAHKQKSRKKNIIRWLAAASVFLFGLASYYFLEINSSSAESKFAALIPANDLVYQNNDTSSKLVVLGDGSRVTLKHNGKLYYPASFNSDKREVYLEGSAFFEIQKNPSKPFYVYYKQLVTKVLGTSFSIEANDSINELFIKVRTGKVQVFENTKIVNNDNEANSVVVIPNQEARYNTNKRQLNAAIVDDPQPLAKLNEGLPLHSFTSTNKPNEHSFIYDQTNLSKVFKEIQETYGLEIILSNPVLNNFTYTGDLSKQDLYTKLAIICLSTKSSYEISGTKIIINGYRSK